MKNNYQGHCATATELRKLSCGCRFWFTVLTSINRDSTSMAPSISLYQALSAILMYPQPTVMARPTLSPSMLQIPYWNNVNYLQCRLSFFTSYAGVIGAFETPYWTDQFKLTGPVTWTVYRDNGAVNAKGEYSDVLSTIVQCTGRQGVASPADTLFEVDSVIVEVAR